MATKPVIRWQANRDELCRLLGISERSLARLEGNGIIAPAVRGRGGRASVYDVAVVVPAFLIHMRNGHTSTDERAARARRDASLAELNEIRVAERRGALVSREEVIREGQAYTKTWASMVMSLPHRLARVGLSHEQRKLVHDVVRELLGEVSRWETNADSELLVNGTKTRRVLA
jgi:phage terminase Nu1 subunit (DNA packaging protein)